MLARDFVNKSGRDKTNVKHKWGMKNCSQNIKFLFKNITVIKEIDHTRSKYNNF